jgi:hypothetical protein
MNCLLAALPDPAASYLVFMLPAPASALHGGTGYRDTNIQALPVLRTRIIPDQHHCTEGSAPCC